jgi:dimethylamine---corrinoid protein Co-methyltransferase
VGAGDPLGMSATHANAAGMGGMRAAGDLVARMQMTRGMRLPAAKRYVADRLSVSTTDLSDPAVMHDAREAFGLGRICYGGAALYPDQPSAMEAKFHIAELLDVPVSCVDRFRQNAGLS